MNKRLIAVICIVVAALAFMGGMIYKYEDFVPLVEVDLDLHKYVFKYIMPLDKETAIYWFDWAIEYHQCCIGVEVVMGNKPLEWHQGYVDMYTKMKNLYLEFDEEWSNE